jgi:enoyl-CoA hydratase/carnithine racemase
MTIGCIRIRVSLDRYVRSLADPGDASRPIAIDQPTGASLCSASSGEDDRLPIDYEKRDGVAYITLNNPSKANIFDKPTADAISDAWIDLWEDRSIRCAILTGKGNTHFCGGHNLAPRENITEEEREYLRTQRIFWPLAGTVHGQKTGVDGRMGDHYPRVWKPVIAAVNGWAAGAGLYSLLASTDIRIASAEHARFKFALLTQGWLGHGPGASLLVKQLRYIDALTARAVAGTGGGDGPPHLHAAAGRGENDEGVRRALRRPADRSGLARAEPDQLAADPDHDRRRGRPAGVQ